VWGGIDIPCKTTTKNILQYQRTGIQFGSLPKTFQDAVRLTAAVGFKYLWIDRYVLNVSKSCVGSKLISYLRRCSLAIIQDDEEDWQRESGKMAAIFRAGTITLSATSADNGHGGCGLDIEYEPVVWFPGLNGRHAGFSARETGVCDKTSTDILVKQLLQAPVNTRAWILQESMLSRRTLHATYSQFVWQCGSLTESEDSAIYIQEKRAPMRMGLFDIGRNRSREKFVPSTIVSHGDEYAFDIDWWRCVADYSSRSLTFSGDQYAAIAGIVQLHQDISKDLPIVGLWKRHLVHHLAWRAYREPHRHVVPIQETANRRPSWTWMSYEHGSVGIRAPISLFDMTNEASRTSSLRIVYQAQVLETNAYWSGQPLTSDPSGSTIRIRGVFHRMPRPQSARRWLDHSPLHLDPGVLAPPEGSGEYDTLALIAYVRNAALTTQPPVITTSYLVIRATDPRCRDEYMRVGSMMLTEVFEVPGGQLHVPRGVQRDITLV
jgi:hypothetical protein